MFWAYDTLIGDAGNSYAAHDPVGNLAFKFANALVTNDASAYEMIDPALKPRLDAWMDSHQGETCSGEGIAFFGPDENGDYDVKHGCWGYDGEFVFEIDNIVIKDMKVVDWGEVREED